MQVIDSFLIVLSEGIDQTCQKVAHMVAFVPRRISCELFNIVHLVGCGGLCHRSLNGARTLLDPLLVEHGRMRVLVVGLAAEVLANGQLELRQTLKHHLLEAQVAPIQKQAH